MTRFLAFSLILCLLFAPFTAHADTFGGDIPLLSGILSNTAQIMANSNVQTTQQFMEALRTAKDTLYSLNQVADTVRNTYSLYRSLKNYTVDQLISDIRTGIGKAYPEVNDLMDEINTFQINAEGIQKRTFFDVQTKWTSKNAQFFLELSDHLQKSVVWPAIAPGASDRLGWHASPVDQVFYSSLISSGMTDELKSRAFRKAVLGEKLTRHCQDADSKGNSTEILSCIATSSQLDADQDIHDLAIKAKLDEARAIEGQTQYEDLQAERIKAYDDAQKNSPKYQDIQKQKPLSLPH